jgi:hypothetical protein
MGVSTNAALQMFYLLQQQDSNQELLMIQLEKQQMAYTIQVFIAAQKMLSRDTRAQEIIQARIRALNDAENELDQRIAILQSRLRVAEAGMPVAEQGLQKGISEMFKT